MWLLLFLVFFILWLFYRMPRAICCYIKTWVLWWKPSIHASRLRHAPWSLQSLLAQPFPGHRLMVTVPSPPWAPRNRLTFHFRFVTAHHFSLGKKISATSPYPDFGNYEIFMWWKSFYLNCTFFLPPQHPAQQLRCFCRSLFFSFRRHSLGYFFQIK